MVASILEPTELEAIHLRLKQLPEPPVRARLGKDDWLGGVGVFLLVVLSMFPVVIPFILMQNAVPALRSECHRHRDVVRGRLCLRPVRWTSPVGVGDCPGTPR